MSFLIKGLDPAPFAALFADDAELAARHGKRVTVKASPGNPCRVSLEDARPGEEVVLVPYEHHPAASPYRGAGPVYVRRGAVPFDAGANAVPEMLRSRTLSVRAYDAGGMMLDAEVCAGTALEPVIERMLDRTRVAYLHVHFAAPGCFACRVDRLTPA
jgi:hypothetical protein